MVVAMNIELKKNSEGGGGVKHCSSPLAPKSGFTSQISNSKYGYNNNGGFGFSLGLLILGFDNLIWFLVHVLLKLS